VVICRFNSSGMQKKTYKVARDVVRDYTKKQFVATLRRLADALESDESFVIQVSGERLHIPRDARVNIEHERGVSAQELEFQLTWTN
jgi:amphi-Trp domain-containing protein